MDFRIKHDDPNATIGYCGQYQDGNNLWQLFYRGGRGIRLYIRSGGATMLDSGYGGIITDTDWHHIAICRVGNRYGIYLDGNQVSFASTGTTAVYDGTFDVGRVVTTSGSGVSFTGNTDEFRIIQTNAFDADPTSALSDSIAVPAEEY